MTTKKALMVAKSRRLKIAPKLWPVAATKKRTDRQIDR